MIVSQEPRYFPRRLPVQLRLAGSDKPFSCTTSEIAEDSLFVQGAPIVASGRTVELIFTGKDGERISVHCVVEPHSGARLLLSYKNRNSPEYERLQKTIWPEWDGRDLLDGLLCMCGRYSGESLADWIRLTTLLGVIQNRRCRFGRPSNTAPRGRSDAAAVAGRSSPRAFGSRAQDNVLRPSGSAFPRPHVAV